VTICAGAICGSTCWAGGGGGAASVYTFTCGGGTLTRIVCGGGASTLSTIWGGGHGAGGGGALPHGGAAGGHSGGQGFSGAGQGSGRVSAGQGCSGAVVQLTEHSEGQGSQCLPKGAWQPIAAVSSANNGQRRMGIPPEENGRATKGPRGFIRIARKVHIGKAKRPSDTNHKILAGGRMAGRTCLKAGLGGRRAWSSEGK